MRFSDDLVGTPFLFVARTSVFLTRTLLVFAKAVSFLVRTLSIFAKTVALGARFPRELERLNNCFLARDLVDVMRFVVFVARFSHELEWHMLSFLTATPLDCGL